MTPEQHQERYAQLLSDTIFGTDEPAPPIAAADLGRDLLRHSLPPEAVIDMHRRAAQQLAAAHPDLRLVDIVDVLMAPLHDVQRAYGAAYHEQLEQQYVTLPRMRMAQSSRLEAVGTLAACIAHDFNTILGVINGHAELLGDQCTPGSSGRASTEQISAAAFRARDLIARLLAFVRQQPTAPGLVDMVALTRDAIDMFRISLPAAVSLAFDAAPGTAPVMADPAQIHQIVLNLMTNAVDAMGGRGALAVRLACVHAIDSPAQPARHYARLQVSDSGSGMPPEIVERIFEPFYTTKPEGRGTGLGLAVVYAIVSELGGHIDIATRVGAGTTFTIDIPITEAARGEQ